jgi:predicted aconitase with swiveling domain
MLILPSGKGSSVVNDEGLFMLKQNKTGPKGIIVKNPDTILVAGAIIMDFPIFDRVEKNFYEFVADDDYLIVDADREVIQLFK